MIYTFFGYKFKIIKTRNKETALFLHNSWHFKTEINT